VYHLVALVIVVLETPLLEVDRTNHHRSPEADRSCGVMSGRWETVDQWQLHAVHSAGIGYYPSERWEHDQQLAGTSKAGVGM
jgi:hypothetical protein